MRNINVYANDSRSSLRLPVRPKCACTLAYLIVPLSKVVMSIYKGQPNKVSEAQIEQCPNITNLNMSGL